MRRCKNAGVIVEPTFEKKGRPTLYKIISNNFILPNEKWIDCWCDNHLEVSNLGRVRKKSTKKLLGHNTSGNYCQVSTVTEKGERKHYTVQRLIYFSFHPELIDNVNNLQIDHINGKRRDNRLENLRALTNVENTKARDTNQNTIRSLETEIILKIGYDKLKEYLEKILQENS